MPYNIYGSLLGLVGVGPVDTLHSVRVNGRVVLLGPLNRGSPTWTDLTPYIRAGDYPNTVHSKYGKAVLFWGSGPADWEAAFGVLPETQGNGNPFRHHPPYNGICVVAFRALFFGKSRSMAPNVDVVVSRAPSVEPALIPADCLTLQDGQTNPVAALAHLLRTDCGIPLSRFDTASWTAAAQYALSDPARWYTSPMLTRAEEVSVAAGRILDALDAALLWLPNGKLAVVLLRPGEFSPGIPLLDSRALTEPPRLQQSGWSEVPTELFALYDDREAQYKRRDVRVDHQINLSLRGGRHVRESLESPFMTRREQVFRWLAARARLLFRPALSASLRVRRAKVVGWTPGTKFLLSASPEPGISQPRLFVVRSIEDEGGPEVQLEAFADLTVSSSALAPSFGGVGAAEEEVPALDANRCLVVPLTGNQYPARSVTAMVQRPFPSQAAVRIYYAPGSGSTEWADLGSVNGFGVYSQLQASVTESADTMDLSIGDVPDEELAGMLPDNALDAEADKLLVLLARLDSNGALLVDAQGMPAMEWCSAVERTALSPGVFRYTVLRGRRGTVARAWDFSQSHAVFLIPLSMLNVVNHAAYWPLYDSVSTGFFKLFAVSYSGRLSASSVLAPFNSPWGSNAWPVFEWTAPADQNGFTDAVGSLAVNVTARHGAGKLSELLVQQIRLSDGDTTVLRSETFTPRYSRPYAATLTFTIGAHLVYVQARTSTGLTAYTTALVFNNTGVSMVPPTMKPPGREFLSASLSVQLDVVAPATHVEWSLTEKGASGPGAWSGTASGVLSKTVVFSGAKRLWARAADDSSNTSEVVYSDYEPLD